MNITTIVYYYAFLCTIAGGFILLITLSNVIWLSHTLFPKPLKKGPKVSVLIPARNEEKRIIPCLESLLVQDYQNYNIYLYDDDSTDGTGKILDHYAREYPGFVRVIHGGPLEAGWFGKPHAMQKLLERSDGVYVLFTDADTLHKPDSIGRAVALAQRYEADLVTGYVHHTTGSFGEAQIIPSIYLLTMVAMPLWLVPYTKSPAISHAIGQFMLFKAIKFVRFGGYARVKHEVTEDVRVARLFKKAGHRIVFADLKPSVDCRMYDSYKSAKLGIAKNVFDYFDHNALLLLGATAAVPLFFFIPLIGMFWVPAGFAVSQPFFNISVIFMLYSWILVTIERSLPWYVPLIYPLVMVNVLSAAWRAFAAQLTGKALEWKGRPLR